MNGLIKQLFTPNSLVAQLAEHKTEPEKDLLVWVQIQGVLQTYCLNFHKTNRCQYLLVVVVKIPLFVNGGI